MKPLRKQEIKDLPELSIDAGDEIWKVSGIDIQRKRQKQQHTASILVLTILLEASDGRIHFVQFIRGHDKVNMMLFRIVKN